MLTSVEVSATSNDMDGSELVMEAVIGFGRTVSVYYLDALAAQRSAGPFELLCHLLASLQVYTHEHVICPSLF